MGEIDMPTQSFIDFAQVRDALQFPAVLQHYGIAHQPDAEQLKISCPFHSPDQNPSCGVNTSKKAFNCFTCKSKGNILEFVALMEELDPQSMANLKTAAEIGLQIMGLNPADFRKAGQGAERPHKPSGGPQRTAKASDAAPAGKRRPESRTAPQATSGKPDPAIKTARRTNPVLDVDLTLDPDHSFFEDHGISVAAVDAFGLGHCTRGIMRNRICIPIHNEHGELVAYSGRWPDDEIPEKEPRYKLPKQFYKSLVLYNLHRAKELGGRHLTLVEGFWSAMRLHLAGIPCVACFGSSVSDDQAALIAASGFRYVTVIFDGDDGGRSGIDQALPVLGRHVYVRTIELEDGVKPDSMPETIVASLKPS